MKKAILPTTRIKIGEALIEEVVDFMMLQEKKISDLSLSVENFKELVKVVDDQNKSVELLVDQLKSENLRGRSNVH